MVSVFGIYLLDFFDKIIYESMIEMYSNIYIFGFLLKLYIKYILRKKF